MILVILCVMITIIPSVAVAEEVIDVASSEEPGVLDKAFVEYDSDEGIIEFNVTFHTANDPLSDNITDIYIDTGDPEGINDETFAGAGDPTETFWNNLGDLNADHRVAIGDDTNVVEPWDEETSQFDGSSSEKITITERKDSYIVVEVSEEDIDFSNTDSPDTIDYKFAFVDGDGIEDDTDYTWAPDDSLRLSLEDGGETIDTGVINATINISDTPVDDAAEVEVSTSDGQTQDQEDIEIDGNSNLSAEFTVDESLFDSADGTVTAELNGENYTLDNTKNVEVTDGDETEVVFEPHRLIEVSDEVEDGGEDEDYTIELKDNDDNTIDVIQGSNDDTYNFSAVNATRLTDGGELEASLDDETSLNSISPQSRAIDPVDRFNPEDVVDNGNNFTIEPPSERITIKTNISEANISDTDSFDLTVNASAEEDDRIDAVKHVVEFDPDQVAHSDTEFRISTGGNETDTREETDQFETVIVNTSGGPVVSEGSEDVPLFNLTFEFVDGFNPPQSESAGTDNSEIVSLETVTDDADLEGSRLINSTDNDISTDLEEDDVKELEFETDSAEVDVFNPETVIEFEQADVVHLTSGGDMVGAPVRFEIPDGAVGSNDGEIDKIVLNNTRNGEIPDASDDESQFINCGGSPTCGGTLTHVPQDDTFLDNGTYGTKSVYNITAVPVNDNSRGVIGENVTVADPRSGGGEEIYKRGDVTLNEVKYDAGNVTLDGDVDSILDLRGQEAGGGLPWDGIEAAQHDVNNDGVIDIVDVTIVAEEYEPP